MVENKLDDFFKNKLEGLKHRPSVDVWERVSEGLEEKEQKSKKLLIVRWSAAASILLVGVGVYWILTNSHQEEGSLISANVIPSIINPSQDEKQVTDPPETENTFVETNSEKKEEQSNTLLVSEVQTNSFSVEKDAHEKEFSSKDHNKSVEVTISERINIDNSVTSVSPIQVENNQLIEENFSGKENEFEEALTSPRVVVTVKLDEKPEEKKRKIDANKILRRLNDLRKGYEINTQASNRKKGNEIN